jgi:hypothetical protein
MTDSPLLAGLSRSHFLPFRFPPLPNVTESLIKNRIAEFVQELDILVRKSTLEALHGVLANGSGLTRRGRPAGKRGPGRPRGSASGNVDEAASKIVSFVRSNDGQGIGAIASATGVAAPVAKKVAKQLLASGQLKKSGEKRGTVYHVGSGRAPRAKAGRRKA